MNTTTMKSPAKTPALYQDKDLRQLLQDTWKLVEQLNYTQMCDLIAALNNVKVVMEYAVRTGMKDDLTGNHITNAPKWKEPIQLKMYNTSLKGNDISSIFFSGNY
jgi:hypothetical protein